MKKFLTIGCMWAISVASAAFSTAAWAEKQQRGEADAQRLRTAYADCVKKINSPAEHVVIPLETFADGRVKSRITAMCANIFPDSGFVWGEGVRGEQFTEDGHLQALITAENCLIDPRSKTGWIEGQATLTFAKYSSKGRGVYLSWEPGQEFVKVFSESEVRAFYSDGNLRSQFK